MPRYPFYIMLQAIARYEQLNSALMQQRSVGSTWGYSEPAPLLILPAHTAASAHPHVL